MFTRLLDHSFTPLPPLDASPPGLLVGTLIVLAVALLTVAIANALTPSSSASGSRGGRPDDSADDVWPPPPKR